MDRAPRKWLGLLLATGLAMFCSDAFAEDGEILIDQQLALQGGITPGDQPGFPITISRSGRYKLIGDLTVPAGVHGIDVTADAVTLDFNGFTMRGTNGQGRYGVYSDVHRDSNNRRSELLTVMNGTITGFGWAITAGDNSAVDSMRVTNNQGMGLGNYGRLSRSTITDNRPPQPDLFAVNCGVSCLIEGNIISNNTNGVQMDSGAVIGNTIIGNYGFGIFGLIAVGFGNNILYGNNGGKVQVGWVTEPLQPNYCRRAYYDGSRACN